MYFDLQMRKHLRPNCGNQCFTSVLHSFSMFFPSPSDVFWVICQTATSAGLSIFILTIPLEK